jgi:hypothetical protein
MAMSIELNFEAMPLEAYDRFRTLASEQSGFELEEELGRRGRSQSRRQGFVPRAPWVMPKRPGTPAVFPPGKPKKPPFPPPRLPPFPARWPGGVVGVPYGLAPEPYSVVPEPYGAAPEPPPAEPLPAGSEHMRWVQRALNDVLGLRLPVHGIADAATRSAIRSFQQREGLPVDGVVGPDTERALLAARSGESPRRAAEFEWENFPEFKFENREYESALDVLPPSELKAVRITSTFETGRPGGFGGLTGNIDGQGLSFGLLNFTIKAGSLIPLLREFIEQYPARYRRLFEKDADRFKEMVFATKPDPENPKRPIRDVERQMAFINNQMNLIPRKDRRNRINKPWKTYFSRLEKDPEFRKIQVKAVRRALDRARYWFKYFGFKTERGFAFMFDLVSSHGGWWLNAPKFKGAHLALLRKMLAAKKAVVGRDTLTELEKMDVIANMIADVSLPEWRDRVRVRKLWFVGGKGTVHGSPYDIMKDFAVTDSPPDFG